MTLPFPNLSKAISDLRLWFSEYQRNLEFRQGTTPYRVWVSEVMSQQTTAKAIIPYFLRFMERFPDVSTLAKASEEDVLHYWSGLGYYSRGRNLLKSAGIIVAQYHAQIPHKFSELIKLPGIGPYTAGAILCFGFQIPSSMVDTNIQRVLCRLRARTLPTKRLQRLSWIFSNYSDAKTPLSPGNTMQALMELGSTLCKIRDPLCSTCCLKNICRCVKKKEDPSLFPAPKKMPHKILLNEHSFLWVHEHRNSHEILLVLPEKRWTKGLWDLPTDLSPNPDLLDQKRGTLTIHYQITNHKIERQISIILISSVLRPSLEASLHPTPYRWMTLDDIQEDLALFPIPMGSGLKKSLRAYHKWRENNQFTLFLNEKKTNQRRKNL